MMIQTKHFRLDIIADFVNQINFQKWLTTNKIPCNGFLWEISLIFKNIINGFLCHLPGKTLFGILPHEIAILASQLAIFRNDKRDVLRHTRSPSNIFTCNYIHVLKKIL